MQITVLADRGFGDQAVGAVLEPQGLDRGTGRAWRTVRVNDPVVLDAEPFVDRSPPLHIEGLVNSAEVKG